QNQQEQEFLAAEQKRQQAAERQRVAAERRRQSQQQDNMLGAIFGGLTAGVVGSNVGMDSSMAMEFGANMATDIYSGGTANTTAMQNRMQGQHRAKMTRLTRANNGGGNKPDLIKNPAGFDNNGDYRDSNGNLAQNPNAPTNRNNSQTSAPDPMDLARQALGDQGGQLDNYSSQSLGTGQSLILKTGSYTNSCNGQAPQTHNFQYYTEACRVVTVEHHQYCGGFGTERDRLQAQCMNVCGTSNCNGELK
ncbi:MAG: hypothetical protein P8I94_07430, partial [Emcibacteraceae bacterium]|nr:hypothetical protein [Emcibacteraceae bacterium]